MGLKEEAIMSALCSSSEAESELRGDPGAKTAKKNGAEGRSKDQGAKSKKQQPIWMWTIEFGIETRNLLRKLWHEHQVAGAAGGLDLNEDLHLTLLYLGGGSDAEVAARHPGRLGGPEDVARLREDIANREGATVEVEAKCLVWDDRIAAIEIAGIGELCANLRPHVTLGMASMVKPRISNELLARKAAFSDLQVGLAPWLQELGLGRYTAALHDWCLAMGAATPEEIAENAADAAVAVVGPDNADEQKRVEEVLARAAQSELRSEALGNGIILRGIVCARRRGSTGPPAMSELS